MKFPKNELIVLCCNNTLVDSLQNVGPNEKLDHSIVSPLQAKRQRDNKHLVNIPQNVGPNERTFHSFSLTSKQRDREQTSSEHPSKCGTK
jgi:hypothetical protein